MRTREISSPMKCGTSVAALLVLAGVAGAAPKATKYQSSITSPTAATGTTIKITKPSKVQVKVGNQAVTFQVKLSGVTDNSDVPVSITGNFEIDLQIGGALSPVTQAFTLVDGKASLKFVILDAALPNGGAAVGDPIEIRAVRLRQGQDVNGSGSGSVFGVAGLTAK